MQNRHSVLQYWLNYANLGQKITLWIQQNKNSRFAICLILISTAYYFYKKHKFPEEQHAVAVQRRMSLNSKSAKLWRRRSSQEDGNSTRITTEYVELPDGQLMFTKLFEPKDASTAIGVIFYSIGFGSYTDDSGYTDMAIRYANLGFIVFMTDWNGQGRSSGHHVIIKNFHKDLVDKAMWIFNYAIETYIKPNKIYQQSIDKPKNYFLAGQSMGGAITILAALKSQKMDSNPYKGIIVIAPMVSMAPEAIPPRWQQLLLVYVLLPICPYAKLVPNATKTKPITSDKELLERIETNPLKYRDNLSIITAYNLLYTTKEIESRTNELRLPMLIIHGDCDTVTDYNRSIQYYKNCGCDAKDKELKIYENVGHLVFEEQPRVYQDTVEWMMKRIGRIVKRTESKEF